MILLSFRKTIGSLLKDSPSCSEDLLLIIRTFIFLGTSFGSYFISDVKFSLDLFERYLQFSFDSIIDIEETFLGEVLKNELVVLNIYEATVNLLF